MTTLGLNTNTFDFISNLVKNKAAIMLEPSKSYLIESRLNPVARDNGIETLDELVKALQRLGAQKLTQQVVEAMTTNETSFFRDLHPFDALRQQIIPDLIEKRAKERTITIWSNACSSGQEIYTIAMVIQEHFPELQGWKVKLIASDLSTQILDKAKQGIFNQTEVNRGLPMPLLLKNFEKKGLGWQIKEEIRKMVEFKIINLIEPFPVMQSPDIVFLRNVLIYFALETKRDILNNVRKIMKPDGFLFLGGAETTMNLDVAFERIQIGKAACYKPQ
ncbi:MAG: protein-glutamate O-methyltransferase CheR [Planctomycetota bacterium]|nr:protein-glutamate O-methyltransferase CheR [Planctomycetota bacterium]